MLFRGKHFEVEIAKFLYFRVPWVGVIYIGPDCGHGCIMRYSPQQLEFGHLEYLEMMRRALRMR